MRIPELAGGSADHGVSTAELFPQLAVEPLDQRFAGSDAAAFVSSGEGIESCSVGCAE